MHGEGHKKILMVEGADVILLTAAVLGPGLAAVILFRIESGCARLVFVYLVPVTRDPG